MRTLSLAAMLAALAFGVARADDTKTMTSSQMNAPVPGMPMLPGAHGPDGMMGDQMLDEGEIAFAYGFGHMDMSGLMDGDSHVTPAEVLAMPNPFAGRPGQPANYRVVPDSMTAERHVIGAAYGVTDWLTLRVRGSHVRKTMEMRVFEPMGTTLTGIASGTSSGVGDTEVAGITRLFDDGATHLHATLGASLPTGSITEEGTMLTPMGGVMTMRRPYGMQLGSGTVDLLPGISLTERAGRFAYGARVEGVLRLGRNDEGYSLGDGAVASLWGSAMLLPGLMAQASVTGSTLGAIDGQDDAIFGPMPTADPANYGGERIELGVGFGYMPMMGPLAGHGVMVEARLPVYQNLNGPQLGQNFAVMAGYRVRF